METNRFSRRQALRAGAAAPLVLTSATRAAAQDATEISFAFWGDPAEMEAYESLCDAFEAENPDVRISTEYTPGQTEYQTKISTSFAAGSEPDVFLINFRRFGQYAASGGIAPLGDRLAASPLLPLDDFYPQPIEAFTFNGQLYGVPQNFSSLVVYFNRDLFDAAGLPYPAPGWTWDEFLNAAIALTQDFNGDGFVEQYGVGIEPSLIRYVPFIWGTGGEIVDNVDAPTELTLDTPEARAGIQFVVDLSLAHEVAPTEPEVLAEDDQSRFMNGRTAMFFQSRRPVPTLREIGDFRWDAAPLPVGPAGPVTVLHSDAFCMSTRAAEDERKSEAAWRFIEFAMSVPGQELLATTGRTVPSRISVANSPAFLPPEGISSSLALLDAANPPASSKEAFLDTIETIRRVPNISTWPEVEEAFNSTFMRAFYGEVSIDDAIEIARERSADAFARAARG